MLKYTDADIECLKAALARYAAKEKQLEDKYTLRLLAMQEEYARLSEQKPSVTRDSWQRVVAARIDVYKAIIEDLQTPADMVISDFEWSKVK